MSSRWTTADTRGSDCPGCDLSCDRALRPGLADYSCVFKRLSMNEKVFHFLSASLHAVCLFLTGKTRLDRKTKVNQRLCSRVHSRCERVQPGLCSPRAALISGLERRRRKRRRKTSLWLPPATPLTSPPSGRSHGTNRGRRRRWTTSWARTSPSPQKSSSPIKASL